MGLTIAEKIIKNHLVDGDMTTGSEIGIIFDHTLTHDVTGTLGYLAFETMNIPKVKAELSLSYVDHNLLQADYKNMDDHMFLKSTAEKFGVILSRAGNGICHSIHYQRFGKPGKTLIGSDSHSTTGGGLGVLCIGAGALDVAMSMAGEAYYLQMPEIVKVELKGKLSPGVAAKDIILELLRRIGVKGGLGKIMEYSGKGVNSLSVPERATITNMGAEVGATTSIFPSDEITKEFLVKQGREKDFVEIKADEDAVYSEVITIDLDTLMPLVAMPSMPDNVVKVSELEQVKVNQVFIGSCTNGSYADIAKAAKVLKGKKVHPDVSLSVSAGTRQTFQELMRDGIIADLVTSGARIMENSCGACTGIGQAPNTGGVSVRTSNRNFKGRSGTMDAKLYLVSPETAAATAITGYVSQVLDVENAQVLENIGEPEVYHIDDTMFIYPPEDGSGVEIYRGPNIKPLPIPEILIGNLEVPVVGKFGDNITTDDITPASATFSALRSNVPEISKITFMGRDTDFVERAKKMERSIIVGGENYGQGSSREHAAVAPMYLGVKAVIAKSIARIHKANLINFGVLPLVFKNKEDYDKIDREDILFIENIVDQIKSKKVTVLNKTKDISFEVEIEVTDREATILASGGKLNFVKNKNKKI